MVRRTKEEALQTKARIMDAAIEVFFNKGLARATLEDIAEAAEVTRGAVYHHFKNKSDLMLAIHEDLHKTFDTILFGTVPEGEIPSLSLYREGFVAMLRKLEEDERHKRMMSLMLTAMHSEGMEELRAIKSAQMNEKLKFIADIFANAMKTGELKQHDPHFMATAFYCHICGIMQTYLESPHLVSPAKDGPKHIENFFLPYM